MSSSVNKKNPPINSNIPIYEDPRYAEFEGISLDKFKAEKEKSQREYIQLKKELETLKEEYEKTKIRTKERENELRGHINNLLIKFRTKDPEQNLKNIKELDDQILSNIKSLEEQTKLDIKEKKKDMETRIKLSLVDSEINYNKELDKKVKEQQDILKSLNEFTQDMQRIKGNYKSIEDKANEYLQKNKEYKAEIKKFEEKNEDLKNEIMKLKHLNNKMSIKLMGKAKNSEKENEDGEEISDRASEIYDINVYNDDLNKIQQEMK